MSRRDFWSQRRAGVEKEAAAEQVALRVEETAQVEAQLADKDDAEILEELGLPEPEQLDSSEQVREFLNSAVPQRLKTRALRRLWRLNPVLANLDGLVDYGEDFTDAATVIENMQTAYQVGKGMMAHVEALAEAEEAKAAKENGDIEEDTTPEEEADDLIAAEEDSNAAPETAALVQNEPPLTEPEYDDTPEPVATARRRMNFQFETHA